LPLQQRHNQWPIHEVADGDVDVAAAERTITVVAYRSAQINSSLTASAASAAAAAADDRS